MKGRGLTREMHAPLDPTTHLYMCKDLPKQNYISMGQQINIKKKQNKRKVCRLLGTGICLL